MRLRSTRWVIIAFMCGLLGSLSTSAVLPMALAASHTEHVKEVHKAMDLFPFLINPHQEAIGSVTDVSGWLEKPAGRSGFVSINDGHFVDGTGQPLRFFGVNLAFGGNFPDHATAERLAKQLARLGINLVRFHHMDMHEAPSGIWQRGVVPRQFDPQQLDRLDYLIARLKENGIYSNLNLHVSRTMLPGEGFPNPERRPDFDKGLGIYHPEIIAAQKGYAKALLTHRNPYTGNCYTEEPAIAQIEITNEDSLFVVWEWGQIDTLPASYQEPLDRLWQDWLTKRYGDTESLRAAWGGSTDVYADSHDELLPNGGFRQGTAGWTLQLDSVGRGSMQVELDAAPQRHLSGADDSQDKNLPALRVAVDSKGSVEWIPQVYSSGLRLTPGELYRVTFWIRADRPGRSLTADVKVAHEPWHNLWSARLSIGNEWQRFDEYVRVPENEILRQARVSFTDLEAQATYWIAAVSVRQVAGSGVGLPVDEGLEQGVRRPLRSELAPRTDAVRQDYIEFLWDVEQQYFEEMYRFIREDLGAKSVVAGTQVPWSPPSIQARLDYVDAHAYWNHPAFPGKSWDSRDWYVLNTSMVNAQGGTLTNLAGTRVAGKPYVISEYNHPAPITFSSEAFLLLSAYGAFQDWDGIVAFAWSHDSDFWSVRIPSFFDIKSHPTKLVTLPAVAALFLRGDVQASPELTTVIMSESDQRQLIEQSVWSIGATAMGVAETVPLTRRLALNLAEPDNEIEANRSPEPRSVYVTDTGELQWDHSDPQRGVVVVDTKKSKAVIGYGEGRTFKLENITIAPGSTRQDGWSAITVTVMEGENLLGPARILLTATGYAVNSGMMWEEVGENRVTVRDRWGQGPPLVEGVQARFVLPLAPERVRVWVLDQSGNRREAVPVTTADGAKGDTVFHIGPQHRTLWYEIEIQD